MTQPESDTDHTDPTQWDRRHEGRLIEMVHTAELAGQHTLKYFDDDTLVVDRKDDHSPVTIADREAETLVRRRMSERYPNDAIAGEEHDDVEGSSGYRWTVDPIDGTKSFICGVPLYSTLLALEHDEQPLGGVIVLPAVHKTIAAVMGLGCWHRRGTSGWQRARCSPQTSIQDSVFVVSQVDSFAARRSGEAYREIERRAAITRSWGDGYGYAMVALGKAHVMIDPECNAWDVAAILPIITEAGGRFTDWKGNVTVRGGDGVGTAGGLHDEVLEILSSSAGG